MAIAIGVIIVLYLDLIGLSTKNTNFGHGFEEDSKYHKLQPTDVTKEEEEKVGTVANGQKCRNMFMNGTNPMLSHDEDDPPPVAWSELHCDSLFCDNAPLVNSTANGNNTSNLRTCQWSLFAIETLMPHNGSLEENVCDADHIQKFYTDSFWERYQFTDGMRRVHDEGKKDWRLRWKCCPQTPPNSSTPSLLDEYYNATLHNATLTYDDLLYKLVKARAVTMPKEELPSPNTLVIHLRLGDVVDEARNSVQELLFEQQYFYDTTKESNRPIPIVEKWNAYVKPMSYFSDMLNDNLISKNNFSKVVIMGAAHKGQLYKGNLTTALKSCQYSNAIRSFLERSLSDTEVTLRLGQIPDDDMIFSSQAAGFISSGGGFSNVMQTLQRMVLAEALR